MWPNTHSLVIIGASWHFLADGILAVPFFDSRQSALQPGMWTYRGPCDKSYPGLDELQKDIESTPRYCINQYLIEIESRILDSTLHDYNEILKQGYDDKFQVYSKYIKELVPNQLDDYMMNHASDHFSCTQTVYKKCCKECTSAYGCPPDCDGAKNCVTGDRELPMDCPKAIPSDLFKAPPKVHYTLRDKEAFFADILKKYGIEESWVTIDKRRVFIAPGCEGSPLGAVATSACYVYWTGFPLASDFKVPDPKDIIGAAMGDLKGFQQMLADAALMAGLGHYIGEATDVIDAASIPVFMLTQAVESMRKIVATANEIKDEEKKQTILLFAMSFMMMVPVAGQEVAGVGLVTIGRVITLTGEVGNAAFGVYGVVQDPKSIVFALFGSLIRGPKSSKEAADVRRRMTDKDVSGLGSFVSTSAAKVENVKAFCFR